MRADPLTFTGFATGVCTKKGTLQKVTERYVGVWVGVADIINHTKFGNDRSREYKVWLAP